MSVLSENLRHLRAVKALSQRAVAEQLAIERGRYAKYEDSVSEPPLDILRKMAEYYHISMDLLVCVDLRKIPLNDLRRLGCWRIILPIRLVSGELCIEIFPVSGTGEDSGTKLINKKGMT